MDSATRASNACTFGPGIDPAGSESWCITASISLWSNIAPP
jgi:hypothetical protein